MRLLLAVPLALAVAGAVFVWAGPPGRERAMEDCGLSEPPRVPGASGVHAYWDWWPPGYVCVFTDRRGRTVAEERP